MAQEPPTSRSQKQHATDDAAVPENAPDNLLTVAFQWCVVRRALILAAIVGSVLFVINHYRCMTKGGCDTGCMVQCGLTFMVPYCVSTVSSVLAYRDQAKS